MTIAAFNKAMRSLAMPSGCGVICDHDVQRCALHDPPPFFFPSAFSSCSPSAHYSLIENHRYHRAKKGPQSGRILTPALRYEYTIVPEGHIYICEFTVYGNALRRYACAVGQAVSTMESSRRRITPVGLRPTRTPSPHTPNRGVLLILLVTDP